MGEGQCQVWAMTSILQGHRRREGIDLREYALWLPRHPEQKAAWLYEFFTANIDLLSTFTMKLTSHHLSSELRASIRCCLNKESPGWCNIVGTNDESGTSKTTAIIAMVNAFQACGIKVLVVDLDSERLKQTSAAFFAQQEQITEAHTNVHDGAEISPVEASMMRACRYQGVLIRSDFGGYPGPDEDEFAFEEAKQDLMYWAASDATIDARRAANSPDSIIETKLKYIQRLAAYNGQDDQLKMQRAADAREYLSLRDGTVDDRFRLLDDAFSQAYVEEELDVVFIEDVIMATSPLLMDYFRPDVIIQDVDGFRTRTDACSDVQLHERRCSMIPLAAFKESVKFVVDFGPSGH